MLHKPAVILFPCLHRRSTSASSTSRYPKPSSKTAGSSYSIGRRGSSFRLGKAPPRTLLDGTPVKGGGYQKQGSESRKELREKEEDEHPLGGEPLPLQDLARREARGGGIVRQVDVDITYQDHMGRAVTSDQRVQDAREAV